MQFRYTVYPRLYFWYMKLDAKNSNSYCNRVPAVFGVSNYLSSFQQSTASCCTEPEAHSKAMEMESEESETNEGSGKYQ